MKVETNFIFNKMSVKAGIRNLEIMSGIHDKIIQEIDKGPIPEKHSCY